MLRPSYLLSTVLLLLLLAPLAPAQEIQLNPTQPAASHASRVTLSTDSLTVAANKPDWVELRFRIAPGFHINSHAPHDELLIPTNLRLTSTPQLKVLTTEYPAGIPLHLTIGAGETLSTYQDDLRIRLQLQATPGNTILTGTLRYQACDTASCFPPRELPLQVAISAH